MFLSSSYTIGLDKLDDVLHGGRVTIALGSRRTVFSTIWRPTIHFTLEPRMNYFLRLGRSDRGKN